MFMCLLHHPNIIQETMARYFHLDKGTIARTVKKMEDAGYVYKYVDPDNRRAFRLTLTDKGYQVAPEIIAIDKNWEEAICTSLTEKEQINLHSLLRKVAESSIYTITNLEE